MGRGKVPTAEAILHCSTELRFFIPRLANDVVAPVRSGTIYNHFDNSLTRTSVGACLSRRLVLEPKWVQQSLLGGHDLL